MKPTIDKSLAQLNAIEAMTEYKANKLAIAELIKKNEAAFDAVHDVHIAGFKKQLNAAKSLLGKCMSTEDNDIVIRIVDIKLDNATLRADGVHIIYVSIDDNGIDYNTVNVMRFKNEILPGLHEIKVEEFNARKQELIETAGEVANQDSNDSIEKFVDEIDKLLSKQYELANIINR